MFYAYVLKSQKNGRLYVGSTDDLKRRLKEYNDGVGGMYQRVTGRLRLNIMKHTFLMYVQEKPRDFIKPGMVGRY
jgi:predicted GIY-YIG superfamily endonuclease